MKTYRLISNAVVIRGNSTGSYAVFRNRPDFQRLFISTVPFASVESFQPYYQKRKTMPLLYNLSSQKLAFRLYV